MATTKKARPRRITPTLQLLWLNLRTRRKLAGVVLLGLAALVWLIGRDGAQRAITEEGAASLRRQLRYDREREHDGVVTFPALEELVDRDRLWPPDLSKPLCTPKIYVYSLPSHLALPPATISQCRWSAYNSELLLHQLLTTASSTPSLSPHLLVTRDPFQADVFFVPLFPACYLFNCWVKAGWKKTERCDVDEGYIQPVMEWVKQQGYWERNGGADHLIAHPMDFGDGYYTETSRAAMNSSTYLVTVGDNRPPPFSSHFRHYRDLVIPSSTHLLNSYYINPMDYLNEDGHPLVSPRGAADPARQHKAVPTQVEIFEATPAVQTGAWGKRPDFGMGKMREKIVGPAPRTTTAIFRGGIGNSGEGEAYALSIRSLFFPSSTGNVSTPPFSPHVHPGFSSLPGYDIAESSENEAYAQALSRSKYGLAPPGYTLDTTRIYEYLAFGVVPVFVGSGPIAGQIMPFEADFDYRSFSISIPRERAHELPRILAEVSEAEYERLRRNVWTTGRLLVLEGRKGNVWKWLARGICRMRRIGTGAGPEISNN